MSLFWVLIRQLAEIQEQMASSKKVIMREEWEKRLNHIRIRKEDMNKLVMNFLVTEGYAEAVAKFRMETGTEPDMDVAMITDRMAVKKAVQCGNVEDAIEKVNDLNPEQSFLEELERTVSLLVFKDVSNCPLRELLDISQRLKTANEVNAAILTSQSHEKGLNTINNIRSLSLEIVRKLVYLLALAQNIILESYLFNK
ncbi:hypothetical protein Gotri_006676 [Gossypium trilobum]|uniref:CTLH domain-containing protein n=1 Tax=Gossypium trilobum TaxID=34281 RepID=A0A7J9F123_9ROSI|nr:hypothetical protein [Gossypium trilobum]